MPRLLILTLRKLWLRLLWLWRWHSLLPLIGLLRRLICHLLPGLRLLLSLLLWKLTGTLWLALLLGPLLGGVADRVDRRRLLVAVNLAMAAVMVPVVTGHVWTVFAALTLVGVGAVLIEAAEAALLPSAVPADLRGDFNGLTRTVTEGMKLFAPAVGAALFTWVGGPAVAVLNAAT